MSAFITLDRLGWHTPDGRQLFTDLTLAFGRERTGLVGRNGVGKTTLIRLILIEAPPSEGAVARAARLGVLRQTLQPPTDASVADLTGLDSIAAIEAALAGYGGAMLVVSHDRDFIEAVGVEREIVLGGGGR
jgi:ATPase subunit of ABC transporter with duplicated ATPase domains